MSGYRREYLLRLPLPLAQLYSAANNSRDAFLRADKAFSVFEAIVRLGASILLAAYRNEVKQGLTRESRLDHLMRQLEKPGKRDWLLVFQALAKHFGTRADAAKHPLGHLWGQLNAARSDCPGMLGLQRAMERVSAQGPIPADSFNIRNLLDSVIEHISGQNDDEGDTLVESITDEQVLPALHEFLGEGVLDVVGPEGSRLIWIEEVRSQDANSIELEGAELVGLYGERFDEITLPAHQSEGLVPFRVAVHWPSRRAPLPLAPVLHLQEGELSAEMLFANRHLPERCVEYVSFSRDEIVREAEMAEPMAVLLGDLTGNDVSAKVIATVVDDDDEVVETEDEPAALATNQIRLRLLERPEGDAPSEWVFTTSQEISVGREQANNAVVIHPRVSRRHAVITYSDSGWRYKNLGANGTLRDGRRADEFTISQGDVVQLAASGPRVQFDLP